MSNNTSKVKMAVRWAFNFRAWQPTKEEWTFSNQCIQAEESARIKQFVFKKDAKSSMIGRLMIRKVVSECMNIPYEEVLLARTDKGKPYVANKAINMSDFNFNVSHSGDYTILAADKNRRIGADIMKLEARTDVPEFFHTMRRQFTEAEWKVIKSPTSHIEQLKLFFRLWCLKESYVKAIGIGIGFEIQRLNFSLPTMDLTCNPVHDTTLQVDGEKLGKWVFEEQLIEDHCVAVATEHDDVTDSMSFSPNSLNDNNFKILTFSELTRNAVPLFSPDVAFWESFNQKKEAPNVMNKR